MKNFRRTFPVWAFCLAAAILSFQFAATGARPVTVGARQIVVPIYQERSLVAVIKVGKLSRAGQRVGFLRVKLLPQMVFDHVRVEFQQPNLPDHAVEKVYAALDSFAEGGPFELCDLQILFPNEKTPRLRAKRMQPLPKKSGPGFVLEGVTIGGRALPPDLSSAKTPARGETGKLRWENNNPAFENFLTQTATHHQLSETK